MIVIQRSLIALAMCYIEEQATSDSVEPAMSDISEQARSGNEEATKLSTVADPK